MPYKYPVRIHVYIPARREKKEEEKGLNINIHSKTNIRLEMWKNIFSNRKKTKRENKWKKKQTVLWNTETFLWIKFGEGIKNSAWNEMQILKTCNIKYYEKGSIP